MSLEKDWESVAGDTITVEPCLSVDLNGGPVFGTTSSGPGGGLWTAPAIVQCNRKLVTMADGKVEVSTTQLFVLSSSGHIGMADRLSWTSMNPPSTEAPRILAVDHAEDESGGQHHVEVSCG